MTAHFIVPGIRYIRILRVMGGKGCLVITQHLIIIEVQGKREIYVLSRKTFAGSSVQGHTPNKVKVSERRDTVHLNLVEKRKYC